MTSDEVSLTFCVLACRSSEVVPFRHGVTEFFPLLRRHLLAASFPATSGAVSMMMASKSAEQDPAQRQQSQRLPERKRPPSEQRRQQPVPQMHDYLAADEDK